VDTVQTTRVESVNHGTKKVKVRESLGILKVRENVNRGTTIIKVKENHGTLKEIQEAIPVKEN
jgi:hypothetical protein